MVSLGKPSQKIVEFLKKKYHVDRYSADDVANVIEKALQNASESTKQTILEKQTQAKSLDPTLKDGCEILASIALVELIKAKGLSVEDILGKETPTSEDDDALLAKNLM